MSGSVKIPSEYTIHVNPLNLTGGIDLGLDDINLDLGVFGDKNKPVTVDIGLDDVNVDLGLDNVNVDLGLDNVNVGLTGDKNKPVTVDLGLDNIKLEASLVGNKDKPITVDLGLDNINACLNLAFTEIPKVKVHFPFKCDFGFSLFGKKIFNFSTCSESMIVTEDNPPCVYDECEDTYQHQASSDIRQEDTTIYDIRPEPPSPHRIVLDEDEDEKKS